MSPVVVILSVLGLVPFIGLGLGALGQNPEQAVRMMAGLIDYAALVLSFIGAVHWGLALAPGEVVRPVSGLRLVAAVVPLLIGMLALCLNDWMALTVLIIGYIGVALVEREAGRRALLPTGYLWVRYGFTVVAVAMLITVLTLILLGRAIVF